MSKSFKGIYGFWILCVIIATVGLILFIHNTILDNKLEVEKEVTMVLEQNIRKLTLDVDALNQDKLEYNNTIMELESEIEKLKKENTQLKKSNSVSRSSNNTNRKLLGTFTATAYTDDVNSQGKWVGQTATGVKPQVGVIAVDPKVISLGTKLFVEGYGQAIAGDVGGAIKGNKVDLFMSTRNQCINFGRKQVKIWKIN